MNKVALKIFGLLVLLQVTHGKIAKSNTIQIINEKGEVKAKQYYFDDSETALMPWFEAMEFCQMNGWEPARIDSAEENQRVADILVQNFQSSHVFWLGAVDWGQDGNFYWIRTGQNFAYDNFAAGYPSGGRGESCAYVWGDGNWYDQYCTVAEVRPLCQLVQ